jgi:hypothetical protein
VHPLLLLPGAVPVRRHPHQNAGSRAPFAGGGVSFAVDFEYQGEEKNKVTKRQSDKVKQELKHHSFKFY